MSIRTEVDQDTHISFFHNWPKDVAYMVSNGRGKLERVTYADLKASRIEKQARRLEYIRKWNGPVRHAAYLWTFYQPGLFGFAYMGWWCYLWSLKEDWCVHFEGLRSSSFSALSGEYFMRMFPCGMLPIRENFDKWKEAFGKMYRRPGRFPKQGLVVGWIECPREGDWPVSFEPIAMPAAKGRVQ